MRFARAGLIFAACLAGCAHSVRTYEGDRRPRREVAILTDGGCSFVVLVIIDEHNRAESQCFKCDPSRAEKFVKLYEAKFGTKPPKHGDG